MLKRIKIRIFRLLETTHLDQRGQTSFEYILLIAVVVSAAYSIFPIIESKLFGAQGLQSALFGRFTDSFSLDQNPKQRYKRFPILK